MVEHDLIHPYLHFLCTPCSIMSQVILLYSVFFSNGLHLLLGRSLFASLWVVNNIDGFGFAFNNSGLSHLLYDTSSSIGRLVLNDLSKTDSLAFITQSEATKLRKSGVFLHGDCLLELNADGSFGVRADVLRLNLFYRSACSVFLSSHKNILDNTFISEGVHMHHAGVSTRHDRLVG